MLVDVNACASDCDAYFFTGMLSVVDALLEAGIVVAPGTAFGAGEGYVRVALVPTLGECDAAIAAWERVGT